MCLLSVRNVGNYPLSNHYVQIPRPHIKYGKGSESIMTHRQKDIDQRENQSCISSTS